MTDARLFDFPPPDTTPYVIERRGTSSAPWTVVHRSSGLTISVERPYPSQDAGWPFPPIQVANHRTPREAEAAAQEIDWALVNARAAEPEWQARAKHEAERRERDAEFQAALARHRDGNGPAPWEREGILHSPVCRVAATLGRTDPPRCPVCSVARPAVLKEAA